MKGEGEGRWMKERTDGLLKDRRMNGWMDGWMEGWMDERMDRRMDGRMNRRLDG